MKKFSLQLKKEVKGVTPQAMRKLMLYSWPGNVRELENVMEYALVMTQDDMIGEEIILQTKAAPEQPLKALQQAKDEFERNYLVEVLEFASGNVSRAAGLAGKYRADFYDLLKKHGLRVENFKRPRFQN